MPLHHCCRVDCAEEESRARCWGGLQGGPLAQLPSEVIEGIAAMVPRESRSACPALWKAQEASARSLVIAQTCSGGSVATMIIKHPKLESLDLCRVPAACMPSVTARCTRLRSLTLTGMDWKGMQAIAFGLHQLPRLTSLTIKDTPVRGNLLSTVIGGMTNLRSLALRSIGLGRLSDYFRLDDLR